MRAAWARRLVPTFREQERGQRARSKRFMLFLPILESLRFEGPNFCLTTKRLLGARGELFNQTHTSVGTAHRQRRRRGPTKHAGGVVKLLRYSVPPK